MTRLCGFDRFDHSAGRFQLGQMAHVWQGNQNCADGLCQSLPTGNGNPRIVFAPQDGNRAPHIGELVFERAGKRFVGKGELRIKRHLPLFRDPGRDHCFQICLIEVSHQGTLDVGLDDSGVYMLRQAKKRFGMLAHMVEEVRPPRPHGDNVHQSQMTIIATCEKMRPQRDGPAIACRRLLADLAEDVPGRPQRLVLWIDQESNLVLRTVLYTRMLAGRRAAVVVTTHQTDLPFDETFFTPESQ